LSKRVLSYTLTSMLKTGEGVDWRGLSYIPRKWWSRKWRSAILRITRNPSSEIWYTYKIVNRIWFSHVAFYYTSTNALHSTSTQLLISYMHTPQFHHFYWILVGGPLSLRHFPLGYDTSQDLNYIDMIYFIYKFCLSVQISKDIILHASCCIWLDCSYKWMQTRVRWCGVLHLDASIKFRLLHFLSAKMSLHPSPQFQICTSTLTLTFPCHAPPDPEHPPVRHLTSAPVIGCSSDTDKT